MRLTRRNVTRDRRVVPTEDPAMKSTHPLYAKDQKLQYPKVFHEHVRRARGTLSSRKAVQLQYTTLGVRTHAFLSAATLARHGRCIVAPSSNRMEGIIATTPARYLSIPATIITDTRTQRAGMFVNYLGIFWGSTRAVNGTTELDHICWACRGHFVR